MIDGINKKSDPKLKPVVEVKTWRIWILVSFVVCVLLVSMGIAVYFYLKAAPSKDPIMSPGITESEDGGLLAKVSKLVLVPEGEVPTIAEVSDPELLRSQPFFANAKTGYKVLIFNQARRAVLYDPVRNLVIEMSVLSNE